MKTIVSLTFLAFSICATLLDTARAQPLTVTTIAGRFGVSGYTNGIGTNAVFLGSPGCLTADAAGDLYVLDGQSVRKISTGLVVTTLAGQPHTGGYGDGASALFDFTDYISASGNDVAVDTNGNVYVAEDGNHYVRKISALGVVSTLAGNGYPGHANGSGTNAQFFDLRAIAVDLAGNVYVADGDLFPKGPTIRKITPAGVVSTLAGGEAGYNDGSGTDAQFSFVDGLAVDPGGTLYVAESWGVRKVSPAGNVTTWAGDPNIHTETDGLGASAGFADSAFKIALDHTGGAYVSDGDTIRYVSSAGAVSTAAGVAGQHPVVSNDGVGSNARFYNAFGIAVDAARNVYITDASEATVLKGIPPSLPAIGSVSESPGVSPIRSNNPWHFTASYSTLVSDMRLRVQSTTTTNDAGSWADLPGNHIMNNSDGNWTLDTTDVPTGTRYFRVIAAAPGYFDSASAALGPETVLDGIAPFGFFSVNTPVPFQTGNLWTFSITESSLVSGLQLRVQSSFNLTNWSDLPNGGQMTNSGPTWTLITTSLPIGEQVFRVVASAPNYVARISAPSAITFDIEPELPAETDNYSTSGFHVLAEVDSPQVIYIHAILQAATEFGCSDNTKYNAAITLAAEQYATATLHIADSQHINMLALTVGLNGSAEFKGTFTGELAGEGGSILYDVKTEEIVKLISQDGSNLVSHDGGSVVSNDGGSLVSHDGGSLASKDGAGIVSQGGGNFGAHAAGIVVRKDGSGLISQDGSTVTGGASPSFPKKNGPFQPDDLTQPTFTGQMIINGNYYQYPGTTLIIGIAGTNTLSDGAQQFDQLDVGGTAYLAGGTIAFGLFDPDDQTNRADVFQPPIGATFDVVVASNIVVGAVHILGPVWGDGLFFKGGVVTRDDGLQAVRLEATHIPPQIFIQNDESGLHLVYGTNYMGYAVESSPDLINWSAFSTGTNVVELSPTDAGQYFRLSKP